MTGQILPIMAEVSALEGAGMGMEILEITLEIIMEMETMEIIMAMGTMEIIMEMGTMEIIMAMETLGVTMAMETLGVTMAMETLGVTTATATLGVTMAMEILQAFHPFQLDHISTITDPTSILKEVSTIQDLTDR